MFLSHCFNILLGTLVSLIEAKWFVTFVDDHMGVYCIYLLKENKK